jgi:hypothetical protein
MDNALSGSGGRSLVSVYSVIVQLLFLVHILILLIICSFTTFLPICPYAPSDSPSKPNANPQDPPDFNRHRILAAAALTDLQFWLHDIQTSLDILRQQRLASSRSVGEGIR